MTEPSPDRLPGALDEQGSTLSPSTGEPRRAVERSAVADAVAARLEKEKQGQAESSAEVDDAKAASAHRMKLRRIINDIAGAVSYEKAHACLELLHTLASNITQHPGEDKFRSFRASQARIAKNVLALDGAQDLLIAMGFRTRTRDFQLEWFVPDAATWKASSLGFKRLQWSADVLAARMEEYDDHAARIRFQKEREKNEEANRKARALAEAQEDRDRVALRAQRERAARRAQEERQRKEDGEQKEQPQSAESADANG